MYKIQMNITRFTGSLNRKNLGLLLPICCMILLFCHDNKLKSQVLETEFNPPSWWFSGSIGGNLNVFQGSTQRLYNGLVSPVPFTKGWGLGLYVAPLIEYSPSSSKWGVTIQAGIDSRKGAFKDVLSPCNCPRGLKTSLNYATIEPSLRFKPFKTGLFVFAGPRISFLLNKSFVYRQENDPLNVDQIPVPNISGDFSNVRNVIYSMQIGAGYDISMSGNQRRAQFLVSPFVAVLPFWGQDPRSIETWNITTFRAGVALKLGRGQLKLVDESKGLHADIVKSSAIPKIHFMVFSPKNVAAEHRVREFFPISNYVFFDLGSTVVPERYILLSKAEVPNFKTDQLEVHIPKRLSGRSSRQMIVYYNLLNILGDRLGSNPGAKIQLIGSSEQGSNDGLLMAVSVRNYLHDVFGIDTSRIGVEGNMKPKLPSMLPYVTRENDLHQEGDRRVSIESNSPEILMEFQSGQDVPLKAVAINSVQIAPLDSYITFLNEGSNAALSSWSMEIQDLNGEKQFFGPYNKEKVTIPGKLILGKHPQGDFKITMVGQRRLGGEVRADTTIHAVLWTPSVDEQGLRYSVLFGFNKTTTTDLYKRYLTEVVVPKIPAGSTVLIHGYTDVIGQEDYNLNLSQERANAVFDILKLELNRIGITDVFFQVYGFGEDTGLMPFENDTPEERFYNRTVIIDIIHQVK